MYFFTGTRIYYEHAAVIIGHFRNFGHLWLWRRSGRTDKARYRSTYFSLNPDTRSYELAVGDPIPTITATATDDVDGDISNRIIVSGDSVDNSSIGTYIRHYDVSDSAGNAAERVSVTFTVISPVNYTFSFGGNVVTDGMVELVEASIVEIALVEREGDYYPLPVLTQVAGEKLNYASGAYFGYGGKPFKVRDGNKTFNIFETTVYAQLPHVDGDAIATLEVEFEDAEGNVVFTDYIDIHIIDQGVPVPESGLYATSFSTLQTGITIAFNTIEEENLFGSPTYTQVYGVSLDENDRATSFIYGLNEGINDTIADPALDGTLPQNLTIKDGITIDNARNLAIIPRTKVDYKDAIGEVDTAEVISVPGGTCNYFNSTFMTDEGTVDGEGALIQEARGFCDLVVHEETIDRAARSDTVVYRYDDIEHSVDVIQVDTDGTVTTINSLLLDSASKDGFTMVLFNESGIVFQSISDPELHFIYTFPSTWQRWPYQLNQPYFEAPFEFRTTSVTDILVKQNPFGDVLLIAHGDESFVTVLRNIRSASRFEERLTFPERISRIDYGESYADWQTLNFIIFSGIDADFVYTRRDELNDEYD
ncbi:immunoglobulin-like domain-containing protein [Aestuariibacter salexigens]|uniref:immunoglobulin-like domain-containing protein n=1 Tax=Aestuariibacter salexigens TaxID=226010 RepID=UPI00040FC92C|nr:immunoglobulin-like domain-containing protein [Aestuariibacter salexigens]